jgi:alkylation response protein AidB-like acyl-CoA dehydrogenase
MPTYKAPLRDQRFVIHELLHAVEALRAMPRYAELDADTVNQVVEEAGRFTEEVLLPINRSGDEEGCTYDPQTHDVRTPAGFADAVAKFREAGWQGLTAEEEFGGQALPAQAGHRLRLPPPPLLH